MTVNYQIARSSGRSLIRHCLLTNPTVSQPPLQKQVVVDQRTGEYVNYSYGVLSISCQKIIIYLIYNLDGKLNIQIQHVFLKFF